MDLNLKIEVTASNGHLAYDYHVTRNNIRPFSVEILSKDGELVYEKSSPISFPNPANDYSTLRYEVKKDGPVSIFLLNFRGEHIKTLENGPQEKGSCTIRHNTSGLNEGIYYYRLLIGNNRETTKLLITN